MIVVPPTRSNVIGFVSVSAVLMSRAIVELVTAVKQISSSAHHVTCRRICHTVGQSTPVNKQRSCGRKHGQVRWSLTFVEKR